MPATEKRCRICRASITTWACVTCFRCYVVEDTHSLAELYETQAEKEYWRNRKAYGM